MAYYVYLMTDTNRAHIHVGFCNDLENTIKFYKEMPTMAMDENYRQNVLVYLEQGDYESQVKERMEQVVLLNRIEKEALVNAINPTWMELLPGINIEFN